MPICPCRPLCHLLQKFSSFLLGCPGRALTWTTFALHMSYRPRTHPHTRLRSPTASVAWLAPQGFLPFSKHIMSQLPAIPNTSILPLPSPVSFPRVGGNINSDGSRLGFGCQNLLFFGGLFLKHSGLRRNANFSPRLRHSALTPRASWLLLQVSAQTLISMGRSFSNPQVWRRGPSWARSPS